MQNRLLNTYLAGTIDEATYAAKSAELKAETRKAEESLEQLLRIESVDADLGLRLFDWSQNLADLWLGSKIPQKREILDLICLNRAVSDVSLVLEKRKPFDFVNIRRTRKLERAQGGGAGVAGTLVFAVCGWGSPEVQGQDESASAGGDR